MRSLTLVLARPAGGACSCIAPRRGSAAVDAVGAAAAAWRAAGVAAAAGLLRSGLRDRRRRRRFSV